MQNHGNRGLRSRKKTRKRLFKRERIGAGTILQILTGGLLIVVLSLLLLSSIERGKQANAAPYGTSVGSAGDGTNGDGTNGAAGRVKELMINNIPVTGLSREEAENKLLDTYKWDIQLSYGGTAVPLENPVPELLDIVLDELYAQDSDRRPENYEIDFSVLERQIKDQVAALVPKWNRSPVKAQLTGRDRESGSWIYTDGRSGIKINEEEAVREVMELLQAEIFTGTINLKAEKTDGLLSAGEVKQKYQVIGSFSTTTTSNSNRNNNIRLAVEALDGLVIFPGEEFSFNKTTGNRTTERGYMPAGAYRNGVFVEEPGGGVCQVSSTLYNAIIFSGIRTTERHPHSFEPSYVIPGEDAMVSYDGYSGPDLKFVNRQDTSVAIRAVFEDNKLTISIIGIPILEDGVRISMRSEKTREYDPPAPSYEEDQTLLPDQEIVVKEGVKGTTWKTWLVTSRDGTVIKEDYFHTSTYKGKPGTVRRNTSGVVVPVQPPEQPSAEPPLQSPEQPSVQMPETTPEAGAAETAAAPGIPNRDGAGNDGPEQTESGDSALSGPGVQ